MTTRFAHALVPAATINLADLALFRLAERKAWAPNRLSSTRLMQSFEHAPILDSAGIPCPTYVALAERTRLASPPFNAGRTRPPCSRYRPS